MAAFPVHIWTIILVFRDISWVSELTSVWGAIGVGSYGLVIAFFESVFVFLLALTLGFLITSRWDEEVRIALLGALILITAAWAIAGQLYFLLDISIPSTVVKSLTATAHPLRILYASFFAIVAPTVLMPVLLIVRSDRALRLSQNLMGRLSLLAAIYLFMDVGGLVVVLIRNL